MAGLRALALLLALLLPALLQAAPRIGLVTMQPGEEYWARFGHNALLVETVDGTRTLYNYGFFDFEQPGFLLRFLRGHMRYQLVALPFEADLAYYAAEGRGVRLQWLRLDPEQAMRLAEFLAWNALPENAEYRYDYFLDNCATRVRDALDAALGGSLRPQLIGRSRGLTYRMESQRLAAPQAWLYLGIHVGLGPFADRVLSRWDESFVPMRLAEGLREARASDGGPLVESERELLPHRLGPEREEPPRDSWPWIAAGLLLAILAAQAGSRSSPALRRLGLAVLAAFWLLCGLGGMVLIALWLLTDHVAAHANANLLLLSPLALLLLPALRPLSRRERPQTPLRWLGMLVAAGAVALPLLLSLRLLDQDVMDFVWLLLPTHLVLLRTLWRREAQSA